MRCDRGGAPYFLGLIVFIVPVDALIDLFWADEIGCIWAGERMATAAEILRLGGFGDTI